MASDDERIKLVLVGDTGVGKTSLVSRLRDNSFNENSKPTIGIDMLFLDRDVEIDGGSRKKKIPFAIWDTAGMERFRSMSPFFYRGTKCVVIVFDLTNKVSFGKIDKWRDEIDNFTNFKIKSFLIGNKKDRLSERDVPPNGEINDLATKLGFESYFEVSAMENAKKEIQICFDKIFAAVMRDGEFEQRKSPLDDLPDHLSRVTLGDANKKEGGLGCC